MKRTSSFLLCIPLIIATLKISCLFSSSFLDISWNSNSRECYLIFLFTPSSLRQIVHLSLIIALSLSFLVKYEKQRKCDMYWPKEGSESYGIITVKLLQEVVMATYILRTFTIRNSKVKKVITPEVPTSC